METQKEQKDKTYRVSNYIKVIKDNDKVVIYNGKTGNIGVIPLVVWNRIVPFQKIRVENIKENKNIIIDLVKRGILVAVEKEEEYKNIKTLIEMNLFNFHSLHLIILPTESCNFRCIYCYESFKKGKMKGEVIEGIKKFISNRIKKLADFTVSWFGGEPLSAIDIMKELSNYFIKLSNQNEVKYKANISTNGYLLSLEVFRKCLEWKVNHFQITIDGPPEIHDKRRKTFSGGKTFFKIWENLKNIKNMDSSDFKIVIRVNVDKTTIEKLPSLFDMFEKYIGKDNRFYFYFRNVFYPGCKKSESNFLPFDKDEEKEILWELFNEITSRNLNFYWDSLSFKPFGRVCYASLPYSIVIGSDGKIYKCTVQFENPLNQIGYILPTGEISINKNKFWKWIYPYYEEYKRCKDCFLLLTCQRRMCPANVMSNLDCEFDERYFEKYLKVYVSRGPLGTKILKRKKGGEK